MSRMLPLVAGLLCALLAVHVPVSAQTSTTAHARVIVKYRSGMVTALALRDGAPAQHQRTHTLGSRHNLALEDGATIADRTSVVQASGLSTTELVSRLAADPDVEMVVPDYRRHAHASASTPNDPYFLSGLLTTSPAAGQWYLHAPSTTLPSAINIEAAWDITRGSSHIVIAMLDSGVRYDHPDLIGKLLPGRDFVSNAEIANDGDGWDTDPSDPGDWVTSTESSSAGTFNGCDVTESMWHGTQTAGIAGAMTHNGVGMAGAGRNVMLLPVRVLGKCGGYDSDIVAAMRWAAGLQVGSLPLNPYPARVVNLSLGSADPCQTNLYASAITELTAKGVTIVVSAGNDGMAVHAPGNCPGVLTVTGLNRLGTKAIYSSLGSAVAISAPGGDDVTVRGSYLYPLLSTSNNGTQQASASIYTGGGSNATIGTSFSAPLVSGTIGLMLSANPNLTVAQVRSLLLGNTRTFPSSGVSTSSGTCSSTTTTEQKECYCTTTTCGAGMLDAGLAVAAAANGVPVANLLVSNPAPTGGTILTISAALSRPASGYALSTHTWSVLAADGSAIAFTNSGDSISLTTPTSGAFTASLTVTDTSGASASASQSFNLKVTAASVSTSTNTSTSTTSDTGGGALDPSWLLGLAAAVLALGGRRRP